jgi:ribosome-binding protein aMBF1 (putative translation factor)
MTLQGEIVAAFLFDKNATVTSIAQRFQLPFHTTSRLLNEVVDADTIRKEREEKRYSEVRFLDSIGYSQNEIATRLGYNAEWIRRILNGEYLKERERYHQRKKRKAA